MGGNKRKGWQNIVNSMLALLWIVMPTRNSILGGCGLFVARLVFLIYRDEDWFSRQWAIGATR